MLIIARRCRVGRVASALLCLAALFSALVAVAQPTDATRWYSGTVTLDEGWLQHEGDDLAWARPAFDDSSWKTLDMSELGGAQPGWRWYRLHLKLEPGHQHVHLLIAGGKGTYELYLNGQKADGAELKSMWGVIRPTEEIFIPRDEDNDITIALRTHTPTMYALWHLPLFLTLAIGSPEPIDNERLAMESQRLYAAIPSMAINLMLVLASIAAFALHWSQRARKEYLWLGFYLLLLGISNGLLFCAVAGLVPISVNTLFADPLIYIFTIMQIEFTFSFAGLRVGRIWRAYELVMLPMPILAFVQVMGAISNELYVSLEATVILPAALLLPVLLLVWYRRGNREAGWLILPSLFPAASTALFDVGTASLDTGWGRADFLANPIQVGPIPLQIVDIGDFLFALAIGVVMFFRFTKVSREQARGAAELEAARGIQQRLVPAKLPEVKGYAIEAAYFPAQEVGGDFYQVFSQADGAQLVVVGDVSGKGLKAAMTGTLALGALRALAAEGLGPAAVLIRLNRQQAETQDGGFITCICARVTDQGEVTLANAGHLSPYRNGEELLVSSDLPLGISPEETYEECTFHLEPGDQLTLLSDGVLEATDAKGELFGFERTRAISSQTAGTIAEAALKFGQEDDITVLTLVRARSMVDDVSQIEATAISG
ncbi:PP2C family protein-serine/threonine phosphatase [Telmatobacter sp. DSM 110680]|uniref:PP2C family protein-serine/threonine phosphatase n=1 Tax=Telmatobacter sp. DSM 110680 TaxID=3036704 RepID=A0AAU7DM41_9BACT